MDTYAAAGAVMRVGTAEWDAHCGHKGHMQQAHSHTRCCPASLWPAHLPSRAALLLTVSVGTSSVKGLASSALTSGP